MKDRAEAPASVVDSELQMTEEDLPAVAWGPSTFHWRALSVLGALAASVRPAAMTLLTFGPSGRALSQP